MTDKSFFTEEEWKALSEAPLAVTLAMVAVGQHGPISMVKEAAASAREIAKPGDRGVANELIEMRRFVVPSRAQNRVRDVQRCQALIDHPSKRLDVSSSEISLELHRFVNRRCFW